MFRGRLDNMIDMRHELVRLAGLVDRELFEAEFGTRYCGEGGCPAKPVRLMVGLRYLKHMHGLSDEAVVSGWVENPCRRHFRGEACLRHVAPVCPSSTARFRRRTGEPGCELVPKATPGAGVASGTVREKAVEPVIGHLKSDGLMGRNRLKGTEGDQTNVLLSRAGHNTGLIVRKLRQLLCALIPEPGKRPVFKFSSVMFRDGRAHPADPRRGSRGPDPEFAAAVC